MFTRLCRVNIKMKRNPQSGFHEGMKPPTAMKRIAKQYMNEANCKKQFATYNVPQSGTLHESAKPTCFMRESALHVAKQRFICLAAKPLNINLPHQL